MSTTKGNLDAPKSGLAGGGYTTAWRATVESETLDPQKYGRLVQSYGDTLRMWDFLMWAKRHTDIAGRTVTVYEEGAITDTLDVTTEVSTAVAGADLTIVSAKSIGRVGFDVLIPAKYTNQEIAVPYNISAKEASGSNWSYTLKPWNILHAVTTAIPVGQKLAVGASGFAPGTGQPASLKRSWYSHTHKTRIMKETLEIEGGQQALQEHAQLAQAKDGSTLVNRSMNETEFRLRIQQADYFMNGQPNTNSLTGDNAASESNATSSDYGMVPAMFAQAMRQYYTGSYGADHFDVIKFLLASQGVGSGMVDYYYGQELGLGIENSGLQFLREFSPGHTLYDAGKIGFTVKQITKNGVTSNLIEIPEFSNPLAYGADGYNFETMGMIFPQAKVTTKMNAFDNAGMSMGAATKKALDHAAIGYLNNNGENRRLIIGDAAGVNGLGYKFTDEYDAAKWYMLTEQMNFFLAMNQTILILKS